MIDTLVARVAQVTVGESFALGMAAAVLVLLVAMGVAYGIGKLADRYGVLVRVEVYDKRRRRATAYNAYAGYNQAR